MMYNHDFSLSEKTDSSVSYKSGAHNVRLDFFDHYIRVAVYDDGTRIFPTWSICPGETIMPRHGRDRLSLEGLVADKIEVKQKDGIDYINSSTFNIALTRFNFHMAYYKGEELVFEDRDNLAYNFEGELGNGVYHYLSREDDEKIFGLGDKTGNINKNGRMYKLETFDAMGYNALTSDPLYKQIPFYICAGSKGSYGIYYDSYANGELNFGQEHNNYYKKYKKFYSEDNCLVFYVIDGTVPEIISRFAYLTGKTMMPPKWTVKYGGSTMNYTDSPDAEDKLRGFLNQCRDYDIDCGQFYLSSGYTQIGEKRYVFHWNRDKIKDPKKLSDDFKKEGVHFLPNIKPAFLNTHPLYEEIKKNGWFLKTETGEPYVFPFWGGYGSYLDFTNDGAYDFWVRCVKENLIAYGYDSPWNDNNEYDIPSYDVYADGFGQKIKAKYIRPLFSLLMAMASREAIGKATGIATGKATGIAGGDSKRFMNVTRSGVAGLQRIAQTWTGDNNTSFEDFRGNHKMAMSMSMSGLFFFGADIGGFAGNRPEPELFLRWIQYGLFQPRFVLHSWNSDGSSTMPWLYPEYKETVKKLFKIREKFLPYIYSSMYDSCEKYFPLIYPVFLKYPAYDIESDYFFMGDSILVCPVFDKGVKKLTVELPDVDGGWYERGKKRVSGTLVCDAPIIGEPLYFIKSGSVIPTNTDGKTVFNVYPLIRGDFEYHFFDDDGESLIQNPKIIIIKVSCDGETVTIQAPQEMTVSVMDNLNRKIVLA